MLSSQTALLASWIYNFSLLDICCLLTDLKHCAWSKCQPTTQYYLLGAPSWAQAPGEERHDWVHIWSNQDTQDVASGLIWKGDRTLQLQGTFVGVSTDVHRVPGMKSYRFQNHFEDDIPTGNFSSITKILFGSDLAEETCGEFIDGLMFGINGNGRDRGVA